MSHDKVLYKSMDTLLHNHLIKIHTKLVEEGLMVSVRSITSLTTFQWMLNSLTFPYFLCHYLCHAHITVSTTITL